VRARVHDPLHQVVGAIGQHAADIAAVPDLLQRRADLALGPGNALDLVAGALTPDGRKLYVANGRSGTASVIDTAAGKRIADVAVGALPWGVVVR
jgi:YVTN family beta-propeller protein